MYLLRCRVNIRHVASSRRAFSSGISPQHSIYVSESSDPYFNLTLEDWLFRHKAPSEPLLVLYRDDPCVVIGRNQNPWKEVNLPAIRRMNVPFIRRRSGGGTVYHDLGNTNYSIHLPRKSFDRTSTSQVILRALQSLGVDANVNDRNDICVGKEKVSGSAYKIVNNRAYHHGTMLISTGLDTLGDLLRVQKDTMITKGVASVRSPVCNIQQSSPHVTHEAFCEAVVKSFRHTYGILDNREQRVQRVRAEDLRDEPYIRTGIAELKSWDWAYGQTPEFTYSISRTFGWGRVAAGLVSKHGLILSCKVQIHSGSLDPKAMEAVAQVGDRFAGQRYGVADTQNGEFKKDESPQSQVRAWILDTLES